MRKQEPTQPTGTLGELEAVLRARAAAPPADSYSVTLLADPERAGRKIVEEAFELAVELLRQPVDRARTAEEAADLVFHTLAGLVGAGVSLDAVLNVLATRRVGS
ncbi:MAG: phosphoribosyl-ATP diphosphatase [Egibacteraceae bacterium]